MGKGGRGSGGESPSPAVDQTQGRSRGPEKLLSESRKFRVLPRQECAELTQNWVKSVKDVENDRNGLKLVRNLFEMVLKWYEMSISDVRFGYFVLLLLGFERFTQAKVVFKSVFHFKRFIKSVKIIQIISKSPNSLCTIIFEWFTLKRS